MSETTKCQVCRRAIFKHSINELRKCDLELTQREALARLQNEIDSERKHMEYRLTAR